MKKVVVWGTFDILHEGHIAFLKNAKRYGTQLYIVVIPDEVVYENKKRMPTNNEQKRLENLKVLNFIDGVFIDSLSTGLDSVINLKPDIFVFGYD